MAFAAAERMAAWLLRSISSCSVPAAAATPARFRAAQLGFTVALVEKDKVGGTCLHRGCIPTKAMLHAAEVADSVRNGSQFGVHAAIDKIDLAGVVSYADSVVGRIYKGLSGLVSARSITVVQGAGRLTQE